MDLTLENQHAAIVLLCECPRKTEGAHTHRRPVASGATQELEVPGRPGVLQIPVTEEVEVPAPIPRIVLRPVGEDHPGRLDRGPDRPDEHGVTRDYSGVCKRCGEVFSCTLAVFEAGLREPAPAPEEATDGDDDQPA